MIKQIGAAFVLGVGIGGGVTKYYISSFKTETVKTESTKEQVITTTKEVITGGTTTREIVKAETRSIVEKSKETVAPKLPDWRVSAGYNFKDYYRMELQRRLAGPVYVGVFADSNRNLGVSIGYEF